MKMLVDKFNCGAEKIIVITIDDEAEEQIPCDEPRTHDNDGAWNRFPCDFPCGDDDE